MSALRNIKLVLFMIFVTIAGCNRGPIVKSDKEMNSSESMNTNFDKVNSEDRSLSYREEMSNLKLRNYGHIKMIELECSFYHNVYDIFPQKLEDIFDGFIFLWPGSVYTNEPVKIIEELPDSGNSNHVGKVYYERISDHQAILHYLEVNIAESTGNDSLVWRNASMEIKHSIINQMSDDKYSPPEFLANMPAEKRFWLGFQRSLYSNFQSSLIQSYVNSGELQFSLDEMLQSGFYFISREGISSLQNGVSSGDVVFDFGVINNEPFFYYDLMGIGIVDGVIKPVRERGCTKAYFSGKEYGINDMVDCPEGEDNLNSIFKSEDVGSYTFPDKFIIEKKDVI